MKAHSSPNKASYCLKRTVIRSGILLILLGFLAVPFVSSTASAFLVKKPLANIVTGGVRGLDSTEVPPGETKTSFRPNLLPSMIERWPAEAFTLLPQQAGETITIHQSDCTTPATEFNLGETVCAKLTGAPVGTRIRRRLTIVNPAGLVVAKVNVTSSPQILTFNLPGNAISIFELNNVDNRGTWRVNNLSTENASVKTSSKFVVRDPAVPVSSLSITKNAVGPNQVADGSVITFTILVTNAGPDSATNVEFTDAVPANSTFAFFAQESGPAFSCQNPSAGSIGTSICSIGSLAKDAAAEFRFVYQLNSGVAAGTEIQNTTTISSTTVERHILDNTSVAAVTISASGGSGGAACTLDCPNNITVSANATQGTTSGGNVTFPPADTFGDCGTLSTSVPSGSFFPVGSTTVSVSSTMGDGACSFVVTVVENQAPDISCPATVEVETADCAGTTVDPGTPTATPSGLTITGERSDGQDLSASYPIGVTTITWTARDSDNRLDTCLQTIRVTSEDQVIPTIVAPPDINASTPADTVGSCGVVVGESQLGSADANDNCTVNVTRTGVPAGNFFPIGTTTITYTATDGAGNTATDTQEVVVTDGPPVIFAPAGATYVCASEVPAADPSQATGPDIIVNGDPQPGPPADSCSAVIVTVADASTGAGSASDPLIITRTYTATDAVGNIATAVQTITVVDDTAPTISAPADTSASADASCQASIPDYAGASTASDNCGNPTVTQNPVAGTLVETGPTTVTVTATDSAGNISTDTVVFTVNDTTAPTITAPADSSASADASCQASIPDYAGASTTSDNCGNPTVTQSPVAGTLVGTGPTTVTVTATDSAGNSSTDTVVFTVNDTTAPTITAPADSSASADASCQAPIPNYVSGSTASDNCGNTTVTQSPAAGTLVGAGATTVTVTAIDSAGNSSTDTVFFTVNDTIAPTLTCPANITQASDPGTCAANINPGTAISTDNCGSTTVTGTRSDGQALNAPYPLGTTTITWTATDGSGNQSTCAQTVTVTDTEAPTITFNSLTIFFNNWTIVFNANTVTINGQTYPYNGVSFTHGGYTFTFNGQTITINDITYTLEGKTLVLWTPTNQYQTVNVTDLIASATDSCDSGVDRNDVVISGVTSDEIQNNPTNSDGNTINDVVVAANCKSVQLRAERDNQGDGRLYRITSRVRDAAGNTRTVTSEIKVRRFIQPVVDSGAKYTITGNCP